MRDPDTLGHVAEEAYDRAFAPVMLDCAIDTSTSNDRLVATVLEWVAAWNPSHFGANPRRASRAERSPRSG